MGVLYPSRFIQPKEVAVFNTLHLYLSLFVVPGTFILTMKKIFQSYKNPVGLILCISIIFHLPILSNSKPISSSTYLLQPTCIETRQTNKAFIITICLVIYLI